jgi:hypothetical protein
LALAWFVLNSDLQFSVVYGKSKIVLVIDPLLYKRSELRPSVTKSLKISHNQSIPVPNCGHYVLKLNKTLKAFY